MKYNIRIGDILRRTKYNIEIVGNQQSVTLNVYRKSKNSGTHSYTKSFYKLTSRFFCTIWSFM